MIITRLRQLLSSRGPIGLLRFIFSRVARVTHENIYHKVCYNDGLNSVISEQGLDWKIQIIDRNNFEDKSNVSLLQSLYHGEIETYINGIKNNSILFAVTDKKKVIHTSFVQFESRYKNLIHEAYNTPLIGNCWTDSQYRGKGLYPKTIHFAAEYLFKNNYNRVLISCATTNIASIKGIEKAQFHLIKELKSYIFLNKFVLQLSIENDNKRLNFMLF